MTEEYLLSKGWTVEATSAHRTVKLYKCPWEKGKYNEHELKYACQMQEQRDFLTDYGIYPKRIQLNEFGWGLWFVLKDRLCGHYCSFVEDSETANVWVTHAKADLKYGYLGLDNFTKYSNNQRLGTSYNTTVDNILIRKYESEAYYYSVPTFPKYMETVMELLKDEYPHGIDEYWGELPKVPSFGLDITTIPEEFKIVAKVSIDKYYHDRKEYDSYENNRKVVNGLLEKYKNGSFDIAEVWNWYRTSDFKDQFQVETLTSLWKN